MFDTILLLSHGRSLYAGQGSLAPTEYFSSLARQKDIAVPACPPGYNVADYLLEIASDPPVALFNLRSGHNMIATTSSVSVPQRHAESEKIGIPFITADSDTEKVSIGDNAQPIVHGQGSHKIGHLMESSCATTFLTQLQVLSGREWKILQRYSSLY